MTHQNVFELALRAALGVALVASPAYAGTKPAISSLHFAAPAAAQPILARTHVFTFGCSTAAIAVSTARRCGPAPAATVNLGNSSDAFTKPERLNETNAFRCASTVAGPKITDPLCAAEATVNRGFSADALTNGSLRLSPPILVRCPPVSLVRRPPPPWCSQVPVPVIMRTSRPVSTVSAHHIVPPPSLGVTLQLGKSSPQLFWTIDP